jgi:hypothetical protein
MNRYVLSLLAAFALSVAACDGSPDGTASSSDDLTTGQAKDCKPETELSCSAGEKASTDGCTQPSAPGAAHLPLARCVADCKPMSQLTCARGEKTSTDGCTQPTAPAAVHEALGRCTADSAQ